MLERNQPSNEYVALIVLQIDTEAMTLTGESDPTTLCKYFDVHQFRISSFMVSSILNVIVCLPIMVAMINLNNKCEEGKCI